MQTFPCCLYFVLCCFGFGWLGLSCHVIGFLFELTLPLVIGAGKKAYCWRSLSAWLSCCRAVFQNLHQLSLFFVLIALLYRKTISVLTRKEDSCIVNSLDCYLNTVGSMGKEVKPEDNCSVERKAAGKDLCSFDWCFNECHLLDYVPLGSSNPDSKGGPCGALRLTDFAWLVVNQNGFVSMFRNWEMARNQDLWLL